jgi:hypothetical protein
MLHFGWNIVRAARRKATLQGGLAPAASAPQIGLPRQSVRVPVSAPRRTVPGRVLTGQLLPPALPAGLPLRSVRISVSSPRRTVPGRVLTARGLPPPTVVIVPPPLGWRIVSGGQPRRRGVVDLQGGLAPVILVTYGPHPGLSVRPVPLRWRPGSAVLARPAPAGNPTPYTLRPGAMVRIVMPPRPGRAWLPRIQWPYTAPPYHPTIEPDAATLVPVLVPDPGRAEHDADLAYGLTL